MTTETRTATASSSGGRWSKYALDTFFAPHLSELTECPAPDVPEMPSYIHAFVLNHAISQPEDERFRASLILLANFIRHVGPAIIEYRDACRAMREYVDALPDRTLTTVHALAVARFQNCLIQLSAGQSCLAALSHLFPQFPPMFKPDDGSNHDRIAKLANRVRHFHEDITDAASKREPGPFPIAPIWLTNTGIVTRKNTRTYVLTYQELAELLTDAIDTAKRMADGPNVSL